MSVCLAGLSSAVQAGLVDQMEKALMPGPLHASHAKYEDDCDVCHRLLSKEEQNKLCLDCHDHRNIAEDLRDKRGFHGRLAEVRKKACRVCHAEHKGRDARMVLLDTQTFNHDNSDFVLRGRHRDAPCKACHKPKKTYRQAPKACVDCHESDDPHDGKLGKRCDSCHGENRWLDFRFDHGQTEFKLRGKHKGVVCQNCHPQQTYRAVAKTCISCHRSDDVHRGRYGKKCKDCHDVNGWATQHFDHDKDTDYRLTGRHQKVACEQCHRDAPKPKAKREPLKTDCYSCHRLHDEHKGQYGRKCKSCHSTKGWKKTTFRHDKTDFPLKGKHKKVACVDCHAGDIYKEELGVHCIDCHRSHDVHGGQQGKQCADCHNEESWSGKVAFDHDLANFPLLGAHATVACEECHASGNFKDAKVSCVSCHAVDDTHRRRLGANCGVCHYVGDWKAWDFDHDKKTDFKLEGAHRGIVCEACHREVVTEKIKLSTDCSYCHLSDDAHNGGFGRRCGRCHGVKSFDEIRM